MKRTRAQRGRQVLGCLLTLVGTFTFAGWADAQSVQHLARPFPGGMPGQPVVTGVQVATNHVTVTWDGPSGYYQLFERQLNDTQWHPLGGLTNRVRIATVPVTYSNAFFRVSGPGSQYGGAQLCSACHGSVHQTEMNTRHAQAFQTLKSIHQEANPNCLPCHTVGYGLPTGFVSESATPQLAGVQCENCHGPAGNHAANDTDPTLRPRVEIAATVCGGCHTGSNQPTFEEWSASSHSVVVEDMNPTNRIDSCGRCHSGTARFNLLQGKPLPYGDANMGIVCANCHDPHRTNAYPFQVRNPLASTNDYFITTSGSFTNQYNPNINLCAQCHNHRGAAWTSSSRAPHHSPQYNVLLGTVGLLADPSTGNAITNAAHFQSSSHALLITNQCVDCHMQSTSNQNTNQLTNTGHRFAVETYEVCARCHVDASNAENLAAFAKQVITSQIQQVKAALDLWAATKAPPSLWSKYGTLAWEYTEPGDLSNGTAGPDSTEQTLIPDRIKQARFNLYIVNYDGSFGTHNAIYTTTLLEAAYAWVQTELSQ